VLCALYAECMAELADSSIRDRMRDGRLRHIHELIQRIESDLDDVRELVARMQRDDEDALTAAMDDDFTVPSSADPGAFSVSL
jgi:hypothetical protein